MTKFRCQHCGHRIAILPRHMGKLVRCPECGSMTHPLAEQMIAGQPAQEKVTESPSPKRAARPEQPSSSPPEHQINHCGNCGRLIGRLEPQHAWHGSVVCVRCHHTLSNHQPLVSPQPRISVEDANSTPKAAKRRALPAGKVRRVETPPAQPSQFSRLLPPLRGGGPIRLLLLLCALGLAVYFVLTFVQFLSVLANVAAVGLLLLLALYFLYRGGSASPADPDGGADSAGGLTKRP